MKLSRILAVLATSITGATLAVAQQPQAKPAVPPAADPFIWLEEVESPKALEWVETRNRSTLAEFQKMPVFDTLYARTLETLTNRDRIAFPSMQGNHFYNFWTDAQHQRGVWRRTSPQSYLAGNPAWETVIDVDSLAAAENVNWAWKGASCLYPEYRLCLVRLSRGGADAVEVREFDAQSRRFIAGGFFLPNAKINLTWKDENTLLVGTDFGPGSLTTSGYARVIKMWRRGTPLASARTVFEGEATDVAVGPGSFLVDGRRIATITRTPSFFESITYVLDGDSLVRLDIPRDASASTLGDQLLVYLRSEWAVGGKTYPQGALLGIGFAEFMKRGRAFQTIIAPSGRRTINGWSTTKSFLLVNTLNNVRGELQKFRFAGGRWTSEPVPAPDFGSVSLASSSPLSDSYFFTYSSFTQPTTLYLADSNGIREVRRMPKMFDATGLVIRQLEATSKDGTRIPFFIVHRENLKLDGTNPTMLYAYGGFEVSQTPGYRAATGSNWLERGYVYVEANIRGGGEFGPAWHRAGLKENRQRVYDDFIAVAEELIARKITSPARLGIQGGSNGGLLVGVAMTQRPDLFSAVVVDVPLLDMGRYHKLLAGASWTAEYGDPDKPEEWAYISRYSPYQNVFPDRKYPRALFTTTTRDDRVHPGHARKMTAKMESFGFPVYYFENTEGGHGSGTTPAQQARMQSVKWAYLIKQLTAQNPIP